VELAPLHPQEPALHHELRDALNKQLANTSFFVWIDVSPTGEQPCFEDLSRMVADIQRWLDSLDPDSVFSISDVPQLRIADPAAEIRVRALPKSIAARGRQPAEIVGNPEPVLVAWA
jgi:hypothetical protein